MSRGGKGGDPGPFEFIFSTAAVRCHPMRAVFSACPFDRLIAFSSGAVCLRRLNAFFGIRLVSYAWLAR
jgi:hypothetical protein